MEFLGGAAAQDKAIDMINHSLPSDPIRLIAYTFDYGPIVVALCTARANSPTRLIHVVLDKASTKTGPAKQQNPMARQLLNAGIEVRLSTGNLLTPTHAEAGRQQKLGSLVGAQHAKSICVGKVAIIGSTNFTVSSRANHEWSVCFPMDEETSENYVECFNACWNNAQAVTSEELVDAMNERTRVAALKARH
jgi:phosphatidylserine/phosphatidylglycerophosphate/cardiolipin synthase-like enzyme